MNLEPKSADNKPEPVIHSGPSLEHIPMGPSALGHNNPPAAAPSKGSNRLTIWLIVLSILWLGILIAGAFLLLQSRDQQKKLEDTQLGSSSRLK